MRHINVHLINSCDLCYIPFESITLPKHTKTDLILKGNYDKAKELLENGADPNAKDFAGWTPMVSSL